MTFYEFINFDALVMANGDCILFLPNSGNNSIAESAFITDYVVGGNVIALALNQKFFAVVAIGVVPIMVRNIAYIDIADSFLHG